MLLKKIENTDSNGDLALHVVDIIESTIISSNKKNEISLRSSCERPELFENIEIENLLKK